MTPERLINLLTRKTSVSLRISEDIVDRVIRHQWKLVNKGMEKYPSIEVSGLGRFDARLNKAETKLKVLKAYESSYLKNIECTTDQKELDKLGRKLENVRYDIQYLENKIDQINNNNKTR